jgi:DNA primase
MDGAIVMEGYMDVITAHQNGITNAVAAMGTAITELQVSILKKMSRNLVLAMDADEAGEEAMIRTAGQENVLGGEIRVIALPEGKDPDDVIRGSLEEWEKLAGGAAPLLDFLFSRTTAGLDLTTARDKSAAAERLLPVVAGMNDPVRQSHYLQKLAGMVNVDLNTMKAMLSKRTVPVRRMPKARREPSAAPGITAATPREDYVLAMLLRYPSLTGGAAMPAPELFFSSENRELLAAILATGHQPHPDNIEAVRNTLNPAQKFKDCVNRLRMHYVKTLAARKAVSRSDGDEEARLEEDVMLSNQLRELDAQGNRKAKSPRR